MIENIPRQTRHGIFGEMAREPRNRGAPLRIVGIDLGTHEIGLHRARLLLVQQFELGRQAGLNREAFKNGFTKSVNGLNTQPPVFPARGQTAFAPAASFARPASFQGALRFPRPVSHPT